MPSVLTLRRTIRKVGILKQVEYECPVDAISSVDNKYVARAPIFGRITDLSRQALKA